MYRGLLHFFTEKSDTTLDKRWVRENQPHSDIRPHAGQVYIPYQLNYFMAASPKNQDDAWDTEKLLRFSHALGQAYNPDGKS